MHWIIHDDGCYVAGVPGHSFELGEWKHGMWLLKHRKAGVIGFGDWYQFEKLQDAFDKAESLAKGVMA